MQDSTISSILKSPLGPTLCKAFAALYRSQPQFPVSYLANWLLQQSKNQFSRLNLKQEQSLKHNKSQQLEQISKQKQQALANRKVEPELEEKLEGLRAVMEGYQFKEDMLEEVLPEFIKEREGVAACYIAELKFPMKKVQEEDKEQEWVEDTEANKILKYIGASSTNKQLMLGKVLEQQKGGVSWDVVLKQEEQEPPAEQNENQEGQSPAVKPPKRLQKIYIPNVLKQPKMHYFRLPKLGSYLGFKWVIENYLVEEAFDKGGEKEKQYHQEIENIKKQHQETLNDLKAELEEKESKDNYLEDEGYIAMKDKLQKLQKKELIFPELKFPSLIKVFLVGIDTLGDDVEISPSKQDNIEHILKYFKTIWEQSERTSLVRDLEIFTTYQLNVDIEIEKLQQEMDAEGTAHVEKVGERNVGEKELKYEVEELKFGLLRRYLLEKGKQYLKVYGSYNIGKFMGLFQELLGFAGVEVPYEEGVVGERKVRWRRVRGLVGELVENMLAKVETISNRIQEQQEQKLNKLLHKLDKYDFDIIGTYNMGLWLLAQFVKKYLELTLLACEIFKEKKEAFLRDRESKIEEKERILEERAKAFEEHLGGLDEEERERFNEGDWYVNYDSEHPVPMIEEIPPEYIDPKTEQELEAERREQEEKEREQIERIEREEKQKQARKEQEQREKEEQGEKEEKEEQAGKADKPASNHSDRHQQQTQIQVNEAQPVPQSELKPQPEAESPNQAEEQTEENQNTNEQQNN